MSATRDAVGRTLELGVDPFTVIGIAPPGLDAAFRTHPDLNKVHARANVDNTASQGVMEKAGMVQEGVLRQNRVERGETIDEAWFGVLRGEWTEAREGARRG
ncbi:MAG TPA: hypothetical protein VE646_01440 [Actinomycetota bacterium]|nr:hypothetical protein [Actinomycetota bacterium]